MLSKLSKLSKYYTNNPITISNRSTVELDIFTINKLIDEDILDITENKFS